MFRPTSVTHDKLSSADVKEQNKMQHLKRSYFQTKFKRGDSN